MTEPPTPVTPPSPAEPKPGDQPTVPAAAKPDQAVPYDRFKEVNDRLKQAESEAAELKKWKDEQEAAKLSEIERAQKEKTDAEERARTAEERATRAEVRSRLRSAASGKVQNADVVVDLSESKLLELAEATAEQLSAHVEEIVKRYDLPTGERRTGASPIGAPLASGAAADVPVGADGKPDHKAGLGRDLLTALTGKKGA